MGISHWQDQDITSAPFLHGANDMYSALCENGWIADHIHLLLNESATKNNILTELDWLASLETDTVLFFFEGHGGPIPDLNGDEGPLDFQDESIGPYDAEKEDGNVIPSTVISDDELSEYTFKADKIVLIFTSCYSGGMIEDEPDNSLSLIDKFNEEINAINDFNQGLTDDLSGENKVVMAACGEHDVVSLSPFAPYAPFSEFTAKGLVGYADKNKDGFVSAEESFEYAKPISAVIDGLIKLSLANVR